MYNGELLRMYAGRLGRILCNVSIVGLCVLTAGLLSALLVVFYALFVIVAIILTLGIIFVYYPDILSSIGNVGEVLNPFLTFMGNNLFLIIGITIGTSILSLILMIIDKKHADGVRIGISSFVCAVVLIIAVVAIAGVI